MSLFKKINKARLVGEDTTYENKDIGDEEQNIVNNDDEEIDIYGDTEDIYSDTEDIYKKEDSYEGRNDIYDDDIDENDIYSTYENEEDRTDYECIIDEKELKGKLEPLAKNGCNIVVTGCTGSGVSTVVYNMAVMLSKMGFSTLIVDFDTVDRAQSYISIQSQNAIDVDSLSLEKVVNNNVPIGKVVSNVMKNLYLLGLGPSVDSYELHDAVKAEKVTEFMASVKSKFDFVIYDTVIDEIIKYNDSTCTPDGRSLGSSIVTMADKLILNIEGTTSGVMKIINRITNIEYEVLLNMIINKGYIALNKYDRNILVARNKINKPEKIKTCMDAIVTSLAGEDIGIHFKDMSDVIEIPYDRGYENSWESNVAYSSTKNGSKTYLNLIEKII